MKAKMPRKKGKDLNELLEDHLRAYPSRRSVTSGVQLVKKSWGVFKVTPKELTKAVRGEIF